MSKTLYFEGAGCVPCNDVENCRIRTAFTNRDGKKIFLEMSAGIVGSGYYYIACDACHYITEDPGIEDWNKSRLKCEKDGSRKEYTKENILAFVNKNCNVDFDKVVILDNLAGYRVFTDTERTSWGTTSEHYNFGDCFNYDEELTKKRIAKVKELSTHFKEIFNQKYDNTSYYIKDGKLTVKINVSERERLAAGYPDREFTVNL